MTSLELPLLVALVVLAIVALTLALAAAARFATVRRQHKRATSEADRVRAIFDSHAADGFARVDQLLFDLRDVRDSNLLDDALRAVQADGQVDDRPEVRDRLRRLYDTFGLIDLHTRRVREARDWRRRVDSANLLGRLGDLRAIPILAEVLRDSYEDDRTVKAAAARALGQFRVEGKVDALLQELKTINEWSSPRIAEVLVDLGELALRPTIAALADESANLRTWATQVLARIGDSSAVLPLVERLSDRSSQVRVAAAEALGRLEDRRAVGKLSAAMLRDPLAQVRAEAARALGRIGDRTAFEALVSALSDSDYWTRMRAVEALEGLSPDDPVPLLEAARDPRAEVAKAAAAALDRSGFVQSWIDTLGEAPGPRLQTAKQHLRVAARAGALDTVLRQLDAHGDFRARARLAEFIGEMAIPEATEALARACQDERWPVRVQALKAYAALAPQDLQPVLEGLDDSEEMVRHAAAQALLELGPRPELRAKLDQLVESLASSPNEDIRAAALDRMAEEDEVRGRKLATHLLSDPAPRIRARAAALLAHDDGPARLRALAERLHDDSALVRAEAARSLGDIGTTQAIEALIGGTVGADDATLENICDALARHGMDGLVDAIDTFMGATDIRSRLAVVWTLGKTEDERSVPLLIAAQEDDRPKVRAAACGALGRFRTPMALEALRLSLLDRSERVRAAAANALGRVGDPALVPALVGALKDPDWFVRRRVLIALGRIGEATALPSLLPFIDDAGYQGAAAHAAIALVLLDPLAGARAISPWLAVAGHHEELLEALQGEDAQVSEKVRSFLGLHTPDASAAEIQSWAEGLRESLTTSRNAADRLRAVELLAAWPPARTPAWLEAPIRTDPDPRIRRRAVELLDSPDPDTAQVLERALQDPDPGVRQAALMQSGRFPSTARAVLTCATGNESHTQDLVVDALAEQHGSDSAPLVDLLMGEAREAGRCAAILALGRVGGPDASMVLPLLLDDPSAVIRAAAAEALGDLPEAAGVEPLRKALEDPIEDVRRAGVVALWRQAPDAVFDALPLLRVDPSLGVRLELAGRLGEDPSMRAMDALREMAKDPHPGVRREALCSLLVPATPEAAASFLEQVGAMDAVEATILRQAILERGMDQEFAEWLQRSRDPRLRKAAVDLLCFAGVAAHQEALAASLADGDPDVRLAVVKALARIDDDTVRQKLTQAAHDPDTRVRAAARRTAAFKVV